MKIEEFLAKNKHQYFSLTNDNDKYIALIESGGHINVNTANIKVTGQSPIGITRPKIVSVDGKYKGFLKNSAAFDDSDDLEIIINFMGNLFGIPIAKEYRVFDNNFKKEALLSLNAAKHENEKFIELLHVMNDVGKKVQSKKILMQKWIYNWIKINSQPAFPENHESYEFQCVDDEDIDTVIQLPINVLRVCYPENKEALKKFETNYYNTIIFDIFTGQTDRSMNNYGIICNENDYLFAPLFDNSTLVKPYLPVNLYSLNGVVIDREELFAKLTGKYLPRVSKIIQKISALYMENRTMIFKLIDMWIDNDNNGLIKKNIGNGYSLFKKYK